jgi:hypothetical protein
VVSIGGAGVASGRSNGICDGFTSAIVAGGGGAMV